MNKLLAVTSAIALAGVVSQAQAAQGERWPRWYVGLSGGLSYLDNSDIGGVGITSGKVDFENGGMGTVSVGYLPPFTGALGNLRLEAELGYHRDGIDAVTINNVQRNGHGAMESVSYMGNLYYDFRNTSRWTPYVGAGAGGAQVKLSRNSGLLNTNSSDSVFAYQLMAGLSYSPISLPMTEWSLGYRYFSMQHPEFSDALGKEKLDNLGTHNVEIGAHFRF